jgi:hypothetical protein
MVPWRTVFFAVNFGAVIVFVRVCAIGVVDSLSGGGSPFAFLGGVPSHPLPN